MMMVTVIMIIMSIMSMSMMFDNHFDFHDNNGEPPLGKKMRKENKEDTDDDVEISIEKTACGFGCGLVSDVGKGQRLFRRDYNYRTERQRPSPTTVPSPAPVGLEPLGVMQ